MTYQTGRNILVAYKLEPGAIGTPDVTVTGATLFRASPSSGLKLGAANVLPTEFRADGMTSQGRQGSRKVAGQYEADLSVATFDSLFEAALRSTWVPTFDILPADITSITTTTNTIVGASGSFITKGVKVGDIVRLSGHSTAANNGKNLRVVGVTASTLTVPTGDLVTDAAPDTTFTLTVTKRLTQGVVSRSFAFEEYMQDSDVSELFKGCRIVGMTLKFAPDATTMVTFKIVGLDEEALGTGASPFYTNPTKTASIALQAVDGKIRVNGVDAVDYTNFEVDIDLNGNTVPVIGSVISPDVFVNPAKVTAKLSGLRKDFTNVNLFLNETAFDVHILCVEPMAEPKNFMSFYFGNCKIADGVDKNFGGDGALVENMPINIGADEVGGAHSLTMIQVNSSAA